MQTTEKKCENVINHIHILITKNYVQTKLQAFIHQGIKLKEKKDSKGKKKTHIDNSWSNRKKNESKSNEEVS